MLHDRRIGLPRGCNGKVIYRSEGQASRTANRNMLQRDVTLRVYECEKCAGFHITSQSIEAWEAFNDQHSA